MILIGIDDTDMLDTRGTGHLAREIAAALDADFEVTAVTRRQLSADPRVPCTHKNSCAVLHIAAHAEAIPTLTERVRALMLADFIDGSDPGLCVVEMERLPTGITAFGQQAKQTFVLQAAARQLAAEHAITLLGLGGTEDGVIGALAGVGLAAGGEDGRYIRVGQLRELAGLQPVATVLAAGITAVQTTDGTAVTEGLIQTDKMRPARRHSRPIAVVVPENGHWQPLKLD